MDGGIAGNESLRFRQGRRNRVTRAQLSNVPHSLLGQGPRARPRRILNASEETLRNERRRQRAIAARQHWR